jgi:hypothetical protein
MILNKIYSQWPGPLIKILLRCASIFRNWVQLNESCPQWSSLLIKIEHGGISRFRGWKAPNGTYPVAIAVE